jgi:dTDP-4-amino-4,6-dideoxygalactose transaminase
MLVQGERVSQFEAALATYAGGGRAIAVSSGTAALHLALLALEVGPGDEVVVANFTFPATANVVELVGARPVLVDIQLGTFNVNAGKVAAAITSRTKAIIVVHEFGLMADMVPINAIAREYGIPVIEDAACALGAAQYMDGRWVSAGGAGTIACFSFHPRKSITTGEGGALVTKDAALAERLGQLRNHGLRKTADGNFDIPSPGLNYRLTEIQGAMGVVQLGRLEQMLAERAALASLYDQSFAGGAKNLLLPHQPEGRKHSYQSYVVVLPAGCDRESVIQGLKRAGIEAVRGAYAVHRLTYYADKYGYQPNDYPESSVANDRALALPLFAGMTPNVPYRVARELTSLL